MLNVSRLIQLFLTSVAVSVKTGQNKPATLSFYKFQLQKIDRAAGDILAVDLRPGHLVEVEFTNALIRAVKRLMKWAVDEELLLKDQFRKLRTPSGGRRERVMTKGEARRLRCAGSKEFGRLLWFALQTACRPGELRSLRWEHCDLEESVIRLTEFKAKGKRKDGMHVRLIPLPESARRFLIAFKAKQRGYDAEGDHVFLSPKCSLPWTPNGLRCAFRTARTKAGLDTKDGEALVLYTARHTRATELTRAGVRDSTLADVLGHTTTAMTRRYLHRSPSDLVNSVNIKKKRAS